MLQHLDNIFSKLPTNAARLFHGRGHTLPGLEFLNVDWFEPVVWVVMYGDVDGDLAEQIVEKLVQQASANNAVRCMAVQRRVEGRARQDVVYGAMPEDCLAQEDGAVYALNFGTNQNIGFFLDARPARQWLRERAEGKSVIDYAFHMIVRELNVNTNE